MHQALVAPLRSFYPQLERDLSVSSETVVGASLLSMGYVDDTKFSQKISDAPEIAREPKASAMRGRYTWDGKANDLGTAWPEELSALTCGFEKNLEKRWANAARLAEREPAAPEDVLATMP